MKKTKDLPKRILIKARNSEYYEIDGKRDGRYRKWFDDGQLFERCYYKNDELDGEYKRWHYNGPLAVHTYYKSNKLDGEYKTWNESRKLLRHYHYKDGVKIKEEAIK